MKKIAVLDKTTIDKIAAGEVVERPSSVVKELVENAIDAGATAVTVEITDGGKKLIRITDNGSGIEADQVQTAFLRHATSKIVKVEDLETIASLGFRGEALSSIAAVSQVELITKTPSALSGTRYVIEGGVEHSIEELGAPEGTTFLVRNLFYNTPARSKFLHSDTTEGNYISTLMEQLALSHPEISFKYIQNKQVKLHTSGNYNVRDVIYSIYGRDITRSLLEIHFENDFMKMDGFVGKPEISRGNRTFENYYINGRYIKNRIISKAIEDAYKGYLMQHKFPFVSLHLEMKGNDLDVNVHPSKMEVRFARGTEVYDAIFQSVRDVLSKKEMIPEVSVGRAEKPLVQKTEAAARKDIPEPFEHSRRKQESFVQERVVRENVGGSLYGTTFKTEKKTEILPEPSESLSKEEEAMFCGTLREREAKEEAEAQKKLLEKQKTQEEKKDPIENPKKESSISSENQPKTFVQKQLEKMRAVSLEEKSTEEKPVEKKEKEEEDKSSSISIPAENEQISLFQEELLTSKARSRHKLIGQLFDTYWLVEFGDNFYIIDQHAAHEKINYENFVKQFKNQTISSQYISPPMVVTLSLREENILKENMDFFSGFGFEIEHFGGKEYCISAVPSTLFGFQEEELFLEMLDHLSSDGKKDTMEIFASRLATMACKAAVKGNNRLSYEEANRMIDELLNLDNPYNCPHGRPTIIAMTKYEMEKKFHRIV